MGDKCRDSAFIVFFFMRKAKLIFYFSTLIIFCLQSVALDGSLYNEIKCLGTHSRWGNELTLHP